LVPRAGSWIVQYKFFQYFIEHKAADGNDNGLGHLRDAGRRGRQDEQVRRSAHVGNWRNRTVCQSP
jgi:hypothetical protein